MKICSGCNAMDELLCGGYDTGILSTIYGPAGSGKTTAAMMATIAAAKEGKKIFYIDTEGGFSSERFLQICNDVDLLKQVIVLKPLNFKEQQKTISTIRTSFHARYGLVVVDTISMHYRIEIASRNVKDVNNELGLQVAYLNEIAREFSVPVLITNQVYSDFSVKDKVKMVGGDMLRYSSKCLIELANADGMRAAMIIKHRSLPENKEIKFRIANEGFVLS